MREIKFRVYHKSSSRMLDWNEFITSYYLNDFMETEKYPRDSSYFKENYEFWSPLMQFTGLTDNKGKEIYEGDLFKIDGHWDTYKVVYNKTNVCFGLQGVKGAPFQSFEYLIKNDWDISESLGNIYENPEFTHKKM